MLPSLFGLPCVYYLFIKRKFDMCRTPFLNYVCMCTSSLTLRPQITVFLSRNKTSTHKHEYVYNTSHHSLPAPRPEDDTQRYSQHVGKMLSTTISCMVPLIGHIQALTALLAFMSWSRLVHAFTAYTRNLLHAFKS